MTQSLSTLSKRTKQEILEEYEKLQEQLEDVRSTAQTVHSQPAMDLIEKTKTKTPQTIDKVFGDFQSALHTHLADLRLSLLDQSTMLQDLQKAIELSKQQLEVERHITVAADALDVLVDDHAKRTIAFETDMEKRKREFDEQMLAKKKVWERETEEYEYQKKLNRERDQVETEEREKALSARETTLREQENEINAMKKKIEQFPVELQTAIAKHEQELFERLQQQFVHEKALLEKETSAQIRLLELNVKNLEQRLASEEQEMTSLKQQAEEANAKAQTLAIKAIERPMTVVAQTPPSPTPPPYHDRGVGRGNG